MTLPARAVTHAELSTTNRVVLIARDVSVGHGRETACAHITVTVHEGERWALLGRNGAGKTTFVRTLCGSLRPLGGILGLNRDLVLSDGVGLVPQRVDIDPHLATTVREFVDLGLVGTPLSVSQRRERVARTLQSLELEPLLRRDWRALSGGQRQRVLLARALVREPSLLVLDEPTAALDQGSERSFIDAIERLSAERTMTVLLITHDLHLATRFCTHAAWFHDGTVTSGSVVDIVETLRLRESVG